MLNQFNSDREFLAKSIENMQGALSDISSFVKVASRITANIEAVQERIIGTGFGPILDFNVSSSEKSTGIVLKFNIPRNHP